MPIALLPVSREAAGGQTQNTRSEIGQRLVGQKQEAAVVSDKRKSPAALLIAPANRLVSRPQAPRGRTKDQHAGLELFLLAHQRPHLNLLEVDRQIRRSLGGSFHRQEVKKFRADVHSYHLSRSELVFFT